MSTTTDSSELPGEDNKNNSKRAAEKWLLERTCLSTMNDLTALTKLNLPNCGISTLPSELPDLVPNLSILFAPKNHFDELPAVIGRCSNLQVRKCCRFPRSSAGMNSECSNNNISNWVSDGFFQRKWNEANPSRFIAIATTMVDSDR